MTNTYLTVMINVLSFIATITDFTPVKLAPDELVADEAAP
jgi:hypothetical protein